jgi:ankyrin repeat protein
VYKITFINAETSMNKQILFLLFFLNISNILHCSDVGKLKTNKQIILEKIEPFLDSKSKNRLRNTCKTYYAKIKLEDILTPKRCNQLLEDRYTKAMVFYAQNNLPEIVDFIYNNAFHRYQITSKDICKTLEKNLFEAYRSNYYSEFIATQSKRYKRFTIGYCWEDHYEVFDVISLFLFQGMDVNINIPTKKNKSILHLTLLHFVAMDKINPCLLTKQIFDHPELNVNIQNEHGFTPLHYAIFEDWYDIRGTYYTVERLLAHQKIDPNIKDNNGKTPLNHVVESKRIDVIRLLLQHPKIDVNSKDNEGNTPLFTALKKGKETVKETIIDILLNNQHTNKLATNNSGNTALHIACTHMANIKTIKILLAAFPENVNLKNKKGKTPLEYAIRQDHKKSTQDTMKIIKLLRQHGAKASFFIEYKNIIKKVCSLFGILGLISASIFVYFQLNQSIVIENGIA